MSGVSLTANGNRAARLVEEQHGAGRDPVAQQRQHVACAWQRRVPVGSRTVMHDERLRMPRRYLPT